MPAGYWVLLVGSAVIFTFPEHAHSLQTYELEVSVLGEDQDAQSDSGGGNITCIPPPSSGECNYNCTIPGLEPVSLQTSLFDGACATGNLTWDLIAEPSSVVRIRVLPDSKLKSGESLVVLEDMEPLMMAKSYQEAWVTSDSSNVSVEFTRVSTPSNVKLTITAYNQSSTNRTLTDLEGILMAPEQTNATGHQDYAVNAEMLWMLDLNAYQTNFSVQDLNLDPSAGDLLIIGYGSGPWEDQYPGTLLSGKFSSTKFHMAGGRAFLYFLSRNHAKPKTPFKISYIGEEIKGSTTTPMTTTDKNHPPTPDNLSFDLNIYITGMDPRLFLNQSTNATAKLRHQLAYYTDVYREQRHIDVWRSVHDDDIQFSSWRLCRYASGWAIVNSGCFRVSWYVEMLTKNGDWAFNSSCLRDVIQTYHNDISRKLGYRVSLTLDEVNVTWFWSITILIVPLCLVIFGFILFNRVRSYRNDVEADNFDADLDERCAADDVFDGREVGQIRKDIPEDVIEEKDRQLRSAFNTDEYEDYDAELRGRHRRQALQARFSKHAPLKSALKSPKPAPVQATNATFEPDASNTEKQAFFPPAFDVAAATQHAKEKESPALELPRVKELVEPEEPMSPTLLYNMHKDGTGTVVDRARPGQRIMQLDNTNGKRGDKSGEHTAVKDMEDSVFGDVVNQSSGAGRKESAILLRRITSEADPEEEC